MRARQIFGRDPSLIAAAIGGVVAMFGSIVLNWSGDTIGVVNAAVAAALIVYTSWGTIDKFTSAVIQLVKALSILAVTFGADITADQTALVIFAIEGLIGAFARTQVTAVEPPPPVPVAPGSVPVTEVR